MLIAKGAKLKVLNRSIIQIDERKSSEYHYVKTFFKDYLKAAPTAEQMTNHNPEWVAFNLEHPRYLKLAESKPHKSHN